MRFFSFVGAILISIMVSNAHAEELVMDYQGLDLLGNLEMAQGSTGLKGQDIVLIVHDTLSSKQDNLISSIQAGFKAQSINSLAINLSLGMDMRQGRFNCTVEHNHRHKDAIGEMAKWIKFLMKQNVKKIHLMGQGRGANQVALYARNAKKSNLGKVVLISPLVWTFEKAEREYLSKYGKSLNDVLHQAKTMIADNEGDMLMDVDFLGCVKARVTAKSFEDYYSPNAEYFTPSLLTSLLSRKVLVVIGEYDSASKDAMYGLQTQGASSKQRLKVIAGADKGFGGVYKDRLVTEVSQFLKAIN